MDVQLLIMKQVILIRKDLGMTKGKCVAQGAHASVQSYRKASKQDLTKWMSEGMPKIVLAVDSEQQLEDLIMQAILIGLPTSLIHDAGKTQVEPHTKTAGAIGPSDDKDVDLITRELKLL